jgi:asparagine synthase (glutamine-hydrolysing)
VSDDEDIILSVNGEIYNHKQLRADLKGDYTFKTESDCEVIMHMVSFMFGGRETGNE